MSPRLVGDCFGVRLLILHFKFQFSKSIMKSSTFHTFLNLTYPLRRNISFPKCSKITQKFTQNRKTLVYVLNRGIWRCLKRERDIGTKAMLSDVKTAFRWNPTLTPPRHSWKCASRKNFVFLGGWKWIRFTFWAAFNRAIAFDWKKNECTLHGGAAKDTRFICPGV